MPNKYYQKFFILIILFVSFFSCKFAFAQADEKIVLSISPPLIKVNMNPGETYNSSIKLVNNNNQIIKVYVQAADFKSGDLGGVEFITSGQEGGYQYSLAKWLQYDSAPIEIAPQETKEIPFTIKLPIDAEPGGHYAALLTGTNPPENIQGSGIKISSMLASLIMLTVNGQIEQQGEIKEFSTDKNFYNEPKVKFNINFLNSGNIHLQPRGEIKVYNFLNKEEGTISINQQTEYGNVLPQSQRKWEFSWGGKKSIFDMGRFKAILFLTFGDKAQETVSQTVYFWVIYLKPLLTLTFSFLLLIFIVIFSIRRYIRKAVIRAQNSAGIINTPKEHITHKISVIPEENGSRTASTKVKTYVKEVSKGESQRESEERDYEAPGLTKVFLAALCALIVIAGITVFLYFSGYLKIFNNQKDTSDNISSGINSSEQAKNTAEQSPIIKDKNGISEIASSSEENSGDQVEVINETDTNLNSTSTAKDEKSISSLSKELASQNETEKTPVLAILNGSGVEGAAKLAEGKINAIGFNAGTLGNADNYNYINSVIKYKEASRIHAEKIGALFGKSIEFQQITKGEDDIIVIVGSSFK
jgi:cytoskeletal protein RodZ